jgi:hypothetical protein
MKAQGNPTIMKSDLPELQRLFWTYIFLYCYWFQMYQQVDFFIGLGYQGKDIVFRFTIEDSSLRDFDPYIIDLFLYEDF